MYSFYVIGSEDKTSTPSISFKGDMFFFFFRSEGGRSDRTQFPGPTSNTMSDVHDPSVMTFRVFIHRLRGSTLRRYKVCDILKRKGSSRNFINRGTRKTELT